MVKGISRSNLEFLRIDDPEFKTKKDEDTFIAALRETKIVSIDFTDSEIMSKRFIKRVTEVLEENENKPKTSTKPLQKLVAKKVDEKRITHL